MAMILIVEDDAFIRELAELTVQDWGYNTLSAGDVDVALLHLRSSQSIDALFTDVYLKTSVLGGCELAHLAMVLRPELRVLYTTGNVITDKIKAHFVRNTLCLRKPYTPDQLQRSLEDLLAVSSSGSTANATSGPAR